MANVKQLRTPTYTQKGVLQVIDFIEAKPGQNQAMAILPLTSDLEHK
jgi:hypothetical protein